MRQEKAFVQGRTCRGDDNLYMLTAPLGQLVCRDSSQNKGVRLRIHTEQGHPIEVAARTDHERKEDNVHEDGACRISGQRFIPLVCVA